MDITMQLQIGKEQKKVIIRKQNQSKIRGYTFQGRYQEKPLNNPGPGQYDQQLPEIKIAYSIRGKYDMKNKMNVPPLGTYDIKGMDKFGYYTNSKFRNTCATLFSPPKSNISPNYSWTWRLSATRKHEHQWSIPCQWFQNKNRFQYGLQIYSKSITCLQNFMNLDFIIFPAPKLSENSGGHPLGQILWIPKYEVFYPSFKGYIKRRHQKQQVFFINRQQESEEEEEISKQIDDSFIKFNPQPVPKFNWQPLKESSESPQIRDSQDGSPEFVSAKMQQLNSISLSHVMKKDYPLTPKNKEKQKSISYSEQNIKIPEQLIRQHGYENIGHIPCMYVDSGILSPNVIIYFHGNAEDINVSYSFLVYLQKNFKLSVIAVEYPGYGLYKDSSPNADLILNDAEYVYNYLNKRLGYDEKNIIIFGRSIGSGPSTYLASKYKPGCLVLMSPFTSLQAAVRDYVGVWASFFIKQRFDNLHNIKLVQSPVFILHGNKDDIIPYKHAEQLQKNCTSFCMLHLAEDMDHINYKLYSDLINPLTEFLNTIKFYAHKSTAPKLPTALFRDPTTTE